MSDESVSDELRRLTIQHTKDEDARIPCPDCHDRPPLDIAEDHPLVAAMFFYCPLCDGCKFVTKARALAVLPHLAEFIKELRNKGGK